MLVTTWSGSRVELTWRVLPRWLLGWFRYLAFDRGRRPLVATPHLCDCPATARTRDGDDCRAERVGLPVLNCRRRHRRIAKARALVAVVVVLGLALLTYTIWRRL